MSEQPEPPAHDRPDVAAELIRAGEGPITVDITTTGRRTGQPRRIEIWMVNVDGMLVIAGTPGPRDWLANVAADSRLVVHFKETTTADVPARAEEVRAPATRRLIYSHRSTRWYREQVSVQELVDHGPTVRLRLDEGASPTG